MKEFEVVTDPTTITLAGRLDKIIKKTKFIERQVSLHEGKPHSVRFIQIDGTLGEVDISPTFAYGANRIRRAAIKEMEEYTPESREVAHDIVEENKRSFSTNGDIFTA